MNQRPKAEISAEAWAWGILLGLAIWVVIIYVVFIR